MSSASNSPQASEFVSVSAMSRPIQCLVALFKRGATNQDLLSFKHKEWFYEFVPELSQKVTAVTFFQMKFHHNKIFEP
jgi:uncharacterized membrane protein YfbV (UPF0208 family)